MAYSTPTLVRKALVPSSDGTLPTVPTHTAADLSDQQLADAIAEADSIIDGYVTRMYATPVALVEGAAPHPLDYWSRNIAAYNATLSYRGSQDFSDEDPVHRRYKATMEALKAVSQGTVSLALPRQGGDASGAGASEPYNPYFGDLFPIDEYDLSGSDSGQRDYRPRPYWGWHW